jgi:ribose transport system substrate-binding protein
MAFVGLKMLDTVHHQNLPKLDSDWANDGFAPVPAFVDTGSQILDKSNVDGFTSATNSLTRK